MKRRLVGVALLDLVVGVRVPLDALLYLSLLYLGELRLELRLGLYLVEEPPWIRLVGLRLMTRLVGLRLTACLVGLRLATCRVGLRLTRRLVGLRLETRLVGLRLEARLVGLRLAARLVGLRLVIRLVGLRLAARLVLVGLRATVRLVGLRLTRRVGVRLLDIRVPPGERLRRRTRGDRDLTEDLLVRGEYDPERVR